MTKTFLNWSSGKDAAMALYELQQSSQYKVESLLTSVNNFHDRVSMHGLRRSMLERQLAAIDLPFRTIELPENPTMEEYNELMAEVMQGFLDEGYEASAFGDIFLEDLRRYREQKLNEINLEGVFPLWKQDTKELLLDFIQKGFKAIVVCVNGSKLDKSFAGRELNLEFLNDLPANVDPCGENGEFHTFCFDGPIFKQPVKFELGEKVMRTYKNPSDSTQDIEFWFQDIY